MHRSPVRRLAVPIAALLASLALLPACAQVRPEYSRADARLPTLGWDLASPLPPAYTADATPASFADTTPRATGLLGDVGGTLWLYARCTLR